MRNAAWPAMDVLPGEIGVNLETSDVGLFARPVGEGHEASGHDPVVRQRWTLSVKGRETHLGERKRFRISITGIPALMRPSSSLTARTKDR